MQKKRKEVREHARDVREQRMFWIRLEKESLTKFKLVNPDDERNYRNEKKNAN